MSFGNECAELVEVMTYRNGDIREAVGFIWSSEEMCQLYRQDDGAGALGESLRGSQQFTIQRGRKYKKAKRPSGVGSRGCAFSGTSPRSRVLGK